MSSRRFLLSTPPVDSKAVLAGEEAHHLAHVLRAQPGRVVELIDGSGRVWQGIVDHIDTDRVSLESVKLLPPENAPETRISLIQSLCKAEKLEWILQKATELGIPEIYLLEAERSVLRIPKEKIAARIERWQKIALAATKQSRRSNVPVLHLPARPAALIGLIRADLKIILSENERCSTLKSILRESSWKSAALCIGPEGGWTSREEEAFIQAGFRPAGLGSAILRTETAAIVAMAILKYELE
jgi:16S rRNA (uracil1498-N3)-methyltransferase